MPYTRLKDIIFWVSKRDVRYFAIKELGRKLTDEELDLICESIGKTFMHWEEWLISIIENEVNRVDSSRVHQG